MSFSYLNKQCGCANPVLSCLLERELPRKEVSDQNVLRGKKHICFHGVRVDGVNAKQRSVNVMINLGLPSKGMLWGQFTRKASPANPVERHWSCLNGSRICVEVAEGVLAKKYLFWNVFEDGCRHQDKPLPDKTCTFLG